MYIYTRIIILHTHSCALYTHPVICARARRPESVPTPAEKPKEEDPWPKESDQEESPMTTWEINYIKYHKFTSTRGSLVTHTPRGAGAVVFFPQLETFLQEVPEDVAPLVEPEEAVQESGFM